MSELLGGVRWSHEAVTGMEEKGRARVLDEIIG